MEEYNLNEPLLSNKDNEYDEAQVESMINAKIRNGFIVKVYSILMIQILLTTFIVFISYYSDSFNKFLLGNSLIFLFSTALLFSTFIIFVCYEDLLRKFPHNYICLFCFTLAESYFIASITCVYDKNSVLFTLFLTFTMVLSLTIYAMKTEYDITIIGGVLFSLGSVLIIASIILFFIAIPLIEMFLTIIIIILIAVYIVYDTQLIIGNHSKVKFSIDDYILASFCLYLDIVNLFIRLLHIFGQPR